mmetsp:Transcript_3709/g.7087  ORF Transcript_3709/g.7087 Transcript_3709/m.7087 type:complete len:362 (-) Transcript_3709:2280-3365(-)
MTIKNELIRSTHKMYISGTTSSRWQTVFTCSRATTHRCTRSYSSNLGHKQPTVKELVKAFPTGTKLLISDIYRYINIKDASQSPRNSWTNQGGMFFIPRRQAEQQRQLRRDLKKVALPILFANIPIVGNAIWIFLAWKPNLFLSRHFYNFDYHRYYVSEEYKTRKGVFNKVAQDFWNTMMIDRHSEEYKHLVQSCQRRNIDNGEDMILDGLILYRLFQEGKYHKMEWKSMDRRQLITLAIASGFSNPFLSFMPQFLIKNMLESRVMDIVLDDANLISENHHMTRCVQLTKEEVLDACAMRGLPCHYFDSSFDSMRNSLSNYLIIMDSVHQIVGKECLLKSVDGIMFVLYFQPIRYYLSRQF